MTTRTVPAPPAIAIRDSGWIDTADVARLIRHQLKLRFPTTKFSVRIDRYSGGSSVDVRWTDGPTQRDVEAVAKPYAGTGFDGMIDMSYGKQSWLLPDGSAAYGRTGGTEGSRGSVPAYDNPAPAPGAQLVRFGASFVFCHRDYSVEAYRLALAEVSPRVPVEVVDSPHGAYLTTSDYRETDGIQRWLAERPL